MPPVRSSKNGSSTPRSAAAAVEAICSSVSLAALALSVRYTAPVFRSTHTYTVPSSSIPNSASFSIKRSSSSWRCTESSAASRSSVSRSFSK